MEGTKTDNNIEHPNPVIGIIEESARSQTAQISFAYHHEDEGVNIETNLKAANIIHSSNHNGVITISNIGDVIKILNNQARFKIDKLDEGRRAGVINMLTKLQQRTVWTERRLGLKSGRREFLGRR